jgi:hypothetical protein
MNTGMNPISEIRHWHQDPESANLIFDCHRAPKDLYALKPSSITKFARLLNLVLKMAARAPFQSTVLMTWFMVCSVWLPLNFKDCLQCWSQITHNHSRIFANRTLALLQSTLVTSASCGDVGMMTMEAILIGLRKAFLVGFRTFPIRLTCPACIRIPIRI